MSGDEVYGDGFLLELVDVPIYDEMIQDIERMQSEERTHGCCREGDCSNCLSIDSFLFCFAASENDDDRLYFETLRRDFAKHDEELLLI